MLLEREDRPGGEYPGHPWLGQYTLDDDNNAVPCYDLFEWGRFMGNIERRKVASTYFPRRPRSIFHRWSPHVSTVFLGLDHAFWAPHQDPYKPHRPMVFETMIFGGKYHGERSWVDTWDHALVHHKVAVNLMAESWRKDTLLTMWKWIRWWFKERSWAYWRSRILNRYIYVTLDGKKQKAFFISDTIVQIAGHRAKITMAVGIGNQGAPTWRSKFLSAASRIRSALSGLSSTRSERTQKTTSRSQ